MNGERSDSWLRRAGGAALGVGREVLRSAGPALRAFWGVARPVLKRALEFLLALIIVFEEWGWRPLADLLGRLARWRPWAAVESVIIRLPPYAALVVFALPTVLLLPLKFLALFLVANGQIFLAGLLFVAAKLVATALVARLFMLTQPALMQIGWFASVHDTLMPWKEALVERVHAVVAVARRPYLEGALQAAGGCAGPTLAADHAGAQVADARRRRPRARPQQQTPAQPQGALVDAAVEPLVTSMFVLAAGGGGFAGRRAGARCGEAQDLDDPVLDGACHLEAQGPIAVHLQREARLILAGGAGRRGRDGAHVVRQRHRRHIGADADLRLVERCPGAGVGELEGAVVGELLGRRRAGHGGARTVGGERRCRA